jgi:pimeloyl-ACP methyl ester carboxylesterase
MSRRSLVLVAALLAGCASPTVIAPATPQALLASEQQLHLQSREESVLMTQPKPAEAKGTILMFHGFSAGPWQYEFLAKKAFDDGYNVFVPRMPGHGFLDADGSVNARELPTARTAFQYEAFADNAYQQAASLGAPVSVSGLSVGGAVALRVAEKHPEVKHVVAYAPFMRPKTMAWLFDSARAVDVVPLNVGDGVLSAVPWGWGDECHAVAAAGQRAGTCDFSIGALNGALAFGDTVLKDAGDVKAPVQFFVTAADDAADEAAIKQFYLKSGGSAKNGWYYYPIEEGIPHPMLHPSEDQGKGQTPALYDMTMRVLDGNETINRGDLPK